MFATTQQITECERGDIMAIKDKKIIERVKRENMWLQKLYNLAVARIKIENLPAEINFIRLENWLVQYGVLAFSYDDFAKCYMALPFNVQSANLNLYGEPTKIDLFSPYNNYRLANCDKFGLIYDNVSFEPIYPHIKYYAELFTLIDEICSININVQRTPFVFKTTKEKEMTIKNLLSKIQNNELAVIVAKALEMDDISVLDLKAPIVIDKLQEYKKQMYKECLATLGIATDEDKKERLISSEIDLIRGDTEQTKASVMLARQYSCDKINAIFGLNLKPVWRGGIYNE